MRVNRQGSVILLGVFTTLFITMLLWGCTGGVKENTESIADIQKREGVPVRVITANFSRIEAYELVGGTAEGYNQTTLTAGIAGKILQIKVKVGENVSQNVSLMTLEPDAAQNYDLVKQQVETIQKSRERLKTLAEQGGVPQETIDRVESEYSAVKQGLDAIKKSQFVLSPFSGTIVNVFQTENSKIQPGDNLATIAKIEKIRIPITVSDFLINKFKVGQLAYAALPDDTIKGLIEKVSLSGQQSTHVFTVEAVFDNRRHLIKPGMYIPVRVIVEEKEMAIALPQDAVMAEGADKFVFVVKEGIAIRSAVKVGIRSGELYEVVDGVADGDIIVVSGGSNLTDSTKVKLVE